MLENSLLLSGNTSAGAHVLLQGVDTGYHSVPLHHINLKSDFASGHVVVGVRPTLPVEDISCYLVSIWPVTRSTITCCIAMVIYRIIS